MWALALVWCGLAEASDVEIGRTRRLGLGVSAGFPPSLTVKYQFDVNNGLAFHAGPTLATSGLTTRLQFEQRVRILRALGFGELGLTWNLGLVVNLVFGAAAQSLPARPGLAAGVGVELALAPAPVAVFAEVSPVFYPLDLLPTSNFLPAGVNAAVGARVYIGSRRSNARASDKAQPVPDEVAPEL